MVKRIFSLSNLTLLTALTLSGIAGWYSILGLTAIFAAAVVPIIVMGGSLEIAKVITTVWLHKYWDKVSWQMKMYLVPAVIALAFLTSMGIFGFLSKAHMDQGVPTGDIAARVALIDEKIKTQRDNIEVSRKALAQMDAQVDQRLSRSETETGVDKAVVIRKQQAKERTSLQNDIAVAQKEINKLNEERAPIASELRKVEAEVGPIKYIAALIYGDDADQNMLERAVRWVIILIVFVFDPLALTLVIASNASKRWDMYEDFEKIEKELEDAENELIASRKAKEEELAKAENELIATKEAKDKLLKEMETLVTPTIVSQHADTQPEKEENTNVDTFDITKHPYIFAPRGADHPPGVEICPPMVAKDEIESYPEIIAHTDLYTEVQDAETKSTTEPTKEYREEFAEVTSIIVAAPNPGDAVGKNIQEEDVPTEETITVDTNDTPVEIETEGTTVEKEEPFTEIGNGYVKYEGKSISKDALKEIRPEYFVLTPNSADQIGTGFGNSFPQVAKKGDTYVRVDVNPNRVFKFDGSKWIEINKSVSDSYLDNEAYIAFLISKVETSEYDIDSMTDMERERIADYLDKLPKEI